MKRVLFVALVLAAMGCRPEIDDDASRLEGPRILAVRSDPPEAKPSERVTLTALFTDGTNAVTNAALAWSFCNARKALAETSPIDPACLSGTAATPLGGGPSVVATLGADACRAFGPDSPLPKPGEPAGRPADPDPTGGFFQPGLAYGSGASPTLFEIRIRCALPSVPQAVSLAYEQQYRANSNPEIATVERVSGDKADAVSDLRVRPGERVRLRVSWATCAGDAPCGGAESYVSYDTASRTLAARRESLVVSWLTSGGTFASPRTGRDDSDPATSSENEWTSPPGGHGSIYLVLRDARGGVSFRTLPFVSE